MMRVRSADRRRRPRLGFWVPRWSPVEAALSCFCKGPVFRVLSYGSCGGHACPGPLPSFVRASAAKQRLTEVAARIIGVLFAPLLHQCLQFGIVPVGQDDSGGDDRGRPRRPSCWHTLALEPEGAAARSVLRDRQLDRAAKRRHPHLAAQHSLIKRDRQIEAQVAAVDA
mgnify:CR=1 FL=1